MSNIVAGLCFLCFQCFLTCLKCKHEAVISKTGKREAKMLEIKKTLSLRVCLCMRPFVKFLPLYTHSFMTIFSLNLQRICMAVKTCSKKLTLF